MLFSDELSSYFTNCHGEQLNEFLPLFFKTYENIIYVNENKKTSSTYYENDKEKIDI